MRSDKDAHEANCIDLIKFKNLELSSELEKSVAEVASVRSDLHWTVSKLEDVKRNNSEGRKKSETDLANIRSELTLVKSQLSKLIVKRNNGQEREKLEAKLTRVCSELKLVKSQFEICQSSC